MATTKLTELGMDFIKKTCSAAGASLLQGKNSYVLPYALPVPTSSYVWVSHATFNGKPIVTNQQLGEALISWYNKYAQIYEIDANVMAAQGFVESGYKIWNYAKTSTASGISQFTVQAVFDIIIENRGSQYKFTQDEINAITKNIQGNLKNYDGTFSVSTTLGKQNRSILHQNIIDNPEIMVKAQCRYMRKISDDYGTKLGSNILFGYNRGPAYIRSNYTDTINNTVNKTYSGYEEEGIDYVWKIYTNLFNNFGYKHLNMNQKPEEFNAFQADVDGSSKE